MKEEQTAEMNKLIKRIKRVYSIIVLGYMGGEYNKVLNRENHDIV